MRQLLIFFLGAVLGGLFLLPCKVAAQKLSLHFVCPSCKSKEIQAKLKPRYADSTEIQVLTLQLLAAFHREGYPEAQALGTPTFHEKKAVQALHIGPKYTWLRLDSVNVPATWAEKVNFNPKKLTNKIFSYSLIKEKLESLLAWANESGYPFAKVHLKGLQFAANRQVSARLHASLGPRIVWDSLELRGSGRFSKRFLSSYLKIEKKEAFNQKKLDEIPSRLRALGFVSLEREPVVSFQYDRAFLTLYIEKIKNNRLDGIVGLMPNPAEADGYVLTGNVNLELRNPFGGGRTLVFAWESPRPGSQALELYGRQPHIFRTGIDLAAGLSLFRQDSSFLDVERFGELSLWLPRFGRLGFRTGLQTNGGLGSNETVENLGDVRYTSYSAFWERDQRNSFFSPRRGYKFRIEAGLGNKNFSAKDSTGTTGTVLQWRTQLDAAQFFPLGQQATLRASVQAGRRWSEVLFTNELFRLGGFNSLRGFSENAFFAAQYAFLNLEYRIYAGQSNYIFTFINGGGFRQNENYSDTPLGFGAGLSLRTGAGQFTFVYALGKSRVQRISLAESRVHFGLQASF